MTSTSPGETAGCILMVKHAQDTQHLVGHGRQYKEIEGDQLLDLAVEERPPRG